MELKLLLDLHTPHEPGVRGDFIYAVTGIYVSALSPSLVKSAPKGVVYSRGTERGYNNQANSVALTSNPGVRYIRI